MTEQLDHPHEVWKPLHYLNLYRITLAALFVTSIFIEKNLQILGSHNPQLFTLIGLAYLFTAVFGSFAIHWRQPSFNTLVQVLAFVDILALTLLMHASGGIVSGLGMLLVVAIAGSSLLTAGRMATLFAAMAVIALLAEQVYSQLEDILPTNYTQAGILGITLFATAILSHVLSTRLRETQALAEQRGIDLANMAQLNEHVIKRIQSGIIVVDSHNNIRLMNQSAWYMLGLPASQSIGRISLKSLSNGLTEQLNGWKLNESSESKVFRCGASSIELLPSFTRLGNETNSGTLISLEDTSRTAQQAQQLKLASLGRLTASIAHEIRNPLGAISHAEQLLAESENLDSADLRLTEIIHNHTERVNGIIENVLDLSRRKKSVPEDIALKEWLEIFIEEFLLSHNQTRDVIDLSIEPEDTEIFIDATQFHQIIWNLCHNGLRFSADYPHNPRLELRGGLAPDSKHVFLEIIDHGTGIDPQTAQTMFEPFFTTDKMGTGLGLYIAKELCEINNAYLKYLPIPSGGSCFRIEFAGTGRLL